MILAETARTYAQCLISPVSGAYVCLPHHNTRTPSPPVMITLLSLSVVVSGLTEISTGLLVYAGKGIVILVLATLV